jgi:hypothetical protein
MGDPIFSFLRISSRYLLLSTERKQRRRPLYPGQLDYSSKKVDRKLNLDQVHEMKWDVSSFFEEDPKNLDL